MFNSNAFGVVGGLKAHPIKTVFLLLHGFGIANAILINFAFKDFPLGKSNPYDI